MENIPLSRLGLALKQFTKIDNYKWYCSILKEHARAGFTIHGMPAPVFVARRMAYVQETDNFGMLEMKNLLVPLCNIAYLLNKQTPDISQLKEYKPKYHSTFDEAYCKDILKMEIRRNGIAGAHFNIIDKLRALQKECWSLKNYTKQRSSKLETFLRINKCTEGSVPRKLEIKYKDLVNKQSKAVEDYTAAFANFKNKLDNEKVLREELVELGASIKTALMSKMKEGTTKAQEELDQAIFWVNDYHGFNLVRNQLQTFNVNEVVDTLYKVTTAAYVTPIPEEFLEATGHTENIPKVKYTQCDFKNLGMNNGSYFKRSKKEKAYLFDVGEDTGNCERQDDCFFPLNGGVHAVPVKRREVDSGGIFKVKTGYQVKLKLSLMNGSVGFGWIRKSFIHGAKKFGFFFLTPVDANDESLFAQKDYQHADFADFDNFHDETTTKEANAEIPTSMQRILCKCMNESENLIVF